MAITYKKDLNTLVADIRIGSKVTGITWQPEEGSIGY
jgi:hypothetical protein